MGNIAAYGTNEEMSNNRTGWNLKASDMTKRAEDPLENISNEMKMANNELYSPINLTMGDPTVFGNLLPHKNMIEAVEKILISSKHNGYAPAVGDPEAKQAIAKHMSVDDATLTEKDIIITAGCSGALTLCFEALVNPGDNILLPHPGFPLYQTLANGSGYEIRSYDLLPEKKWEIDLVQLESLIDERTACILVNNPSNPCGSVYSKEHLTAICKIAERHHLPIIADEIYAHCVFSNEVFVAMAACTATVPIFSCCALSKRFLVPGWRLGWIQIHDKNNLFPEIRAGLADLSNRVMGANTVIQGALPQILDTPQEWHDDNMKFIESVSDMAYNTFKEIPGLKPIRPCGAMYMMVGIDTSLLRSIKNDIHFTKDLMSKKSVSCFPGSVFGLENYFRITLTGPLDTVTEACGRIADYCNEMKINSS